MSSPLQQLKATGCKNRAAMPTENGNDVSVQILSRGRVKSFTALSNSDPLFCSAESAAIES